MKKAALAALAVLSMFSFASAAETSESDAKAIKAMLEGAVNDTIAVLKDKANDRETRRRKIYAIIDPVVDFPLMGKLTLGRAHWGQFDEAQRKEFIDLFSRTIRDSVFDKVEVYTNETTEFDTPTPTDKGKYEMVMHVISNGQRYKAVFKVYRSKESWKAYDLEIEGISMVRTYAAQYDQVLQKGTPADLLAKLKAKALAVPDDIKNVGKSATARAR